MKNDQSEILEIEIANAHALLAKHLDNWVHLIVKNHSVKGFGNTMPVIEKVLGSCTKLLRSNISYYTDMADMVSKQGYSNEADRYRLVAKIYESLTHGKP